MMSTETIREMTLERTRAARRAKKEPYEIWPGCIENFPPYPFPFLGDYRPKGWRKVNEYFVDNSGFGEPGEPALNSSQFLEKLKIGYAYAITEAGQFQVYIAEFKRVKPRAKKGETV